MERSKSLLLAFLAALCVAAQLATARAAIVISDDVDPANPGDWNSSTDGYVGKTGDGALEVNGGSDLFSGLGYIGYEASATGQVTVDGAGSMWTNSSNLVVGESGRGTLNITDGAAVSGSFGSIGVYSSSTGVVTVDGAGSTWTNSSGLSVARHGSGTLNVTGGAAVGNSSGSIGRRPGSTGVVTVDGAGSTWTNSSLYVGTYASGTLNITGGAAVSNTYARIGYDFDSTGVVTVDGAGSTWTSSSDLDVGYDGSGTLNISGGATVSNASGLIGDRSGSTGVVTVDGAGSMWTSGGDLYVGYVGSGTLNISGGAAVSNTDAHIGYYSGWTGVVTVDGAGSTWTNSGALYLGGGTLNISGAAVVSATDVWMYGQALLAIDVGNGSLLESDGGSGTITNHGKLRILAGAGATADNVYRPIAATTWSGIGVYQAVGGTWNTASHEFTASGVGSGTSGSMATIDRSEVQRVLIADSGTGWSVGVSFLAADVPSELNLTATPIGATTLTDLESLLDPGDSVLGGWTFAVTGGGYAEDDPAYLSFDLGPGFLRSELNLWHYDGIEWTEYAAADLTYNGQYASFTVTGLSGYAVSAVPEPNTLALLGAAALALLAAARWKPKVTTVGLPWLAGARRRAAK